MKVVRYLFDGLFKLIVILNMIMLVTIVLVTAANVFGRYVLNAPIFWAEELCTRLMLTLGMLAAACGVYMHSHMVIQFFLMLAPEKIRWVIGRISDLIMVLIGLIMVIGGLARVAVSIEFYSELAATGLPSFVQDIAIPLAGLLIFYASLINFLGLDKGENALQKTFEDKAASNV
jgi:TRAP-type C4-dicarboxylate transport system permease small subunit